MVSYVVTSLEIHERRQKKQVMTKMTLKHRGQNNTKPCSQSGVRSSHRLNRCILTGLVILAQSLTHNYFFRVCVHVVVVLWLSDKEKNHGAEITTILFSVC